MESSSLSSMEVSQGSVASEEVSANNDLVDIQPDAPVANDQQSVASAPVESVPSSCDSMDLS